VVVPAHNESTALVPTLHSLATSLAPGDRLLVVADNCDDDTAGIARGCGTEVVERFDTQNRGKSFALDFGVRQLTGDPPDVVVIMDADCIMGAADLGSIARQSFESGRPVQALYLMDAPAELGLGGRIAVFAWRIKNHARPLGLHNLGLPCQLMGTGMAFPWATISQAKLASGHIVEDLQLGLDLANTGTSPLFAPDARVTSSFAANAEGSRNQRTRWEHGHLHMILSQAPRMFWRAVWSGNAGLLGLVLDLLVPPLALLLLLVISSTALSMLLASLYPRFVPALVMSTATLVLFFLALAIAWLRFGRDVVSLRDLFFAPIYVLRKIPLYFRFITARQAKWIRSERDHKN
jgi:cellulose synthase/poly-beta-1,6-N-acetylglucosamine synthase-like glycosyltransferase